MTTATSLKATTTEPQADGAPNEAAQALGRLAEIGMTDVWQVALLLPESYVDYRHVQCDARAFDVDKHVAIEGQVRADPSSTFGAGPPRMTVRLQLADYTVVTATWFGDTREIQPQLKRGRMAVVAGTLSSFNDTWQIKNPVLIDSRWKGRCQPQYGGVGRRIGADTLRERVVGNLREALEPATAFCEAQLGDLASHAEIMSAIRAPTGVEGFGRLMAWAHCPPTPEQGVQATAAMERFASLVTLHKLLLSHERTAVKRQALPLDPSKRIAQWPFAPSPSQAEAMAKLTTVFSADTVTSALLSGDTGTGKTLTYATIAASVVDCGGRVGILLPGELLARQIASVIGKQFPDLRISLVTAETSVAGEGANVVIGTTAMLTRPVGEFDLVICDEQQKLGAKQRQTLRGKKAHTLDVTATAIPRTQALSQFGLIETVHLREGHSKKSIKTTLWDRRDVRQLFAKTKETIDAGGRVLVVYPAIEQKKGEKALRSIESAISKWEAAFPGQVRVLTGRVKAEERREHLADLVSGKARIGVCTSVVEVGIDLPDMRRVVVVHPERFGLTTLHQFRGRLAREGGAGAFDMLLMQDISDDTRERLNVMVTTSDGYDLAEADLRLRGPGELMAKGTRQSGGALSILYGRPLNPEHLAEVEPVLRRWVDRQETRHEVKDVNT